MVYRLQIEKAGKWHLFRPVFDTEAVALRRFAEAAAALPDRDVRLVDGEGKVLATSSPRGPGELKTNMKPAEA